MRRIITYRAKSIRLFLAVLLALAVYATIKIGPAGPAGKAWLAGEAAAIAVFLIWPKLFFPIYRVLIIGSSFIGQTVFLGLSLLMFVLVLTPISVLRRLFRKEFIPTRIDPAAPTYFEAPSEPGPVERQF